MIGLAHAPGALALVLALSGCTAAPATTGSGSTPPASAAGGSAAPSASGSATAAAATAETPATTPSALPSVADGLVLAEPVAAAPAWRPAFALPYGDAPGRLGTSLGGDGEGVRWGPGYGVEVPDGSWWILDSGHRRLAHYADGGAYLGQVVLPASFLHQGVYVQWAHPVALNDGTVVLVSTTVDAPALLLLAPAGTLSRVTLSRDVMFSYTDGSALYGFDSDQRGVRVDPHTGLVTAVDAFPDRSGRPFTLRVAAGELGVTRAGASRTLPVTAAAYAGRTVHPAIEVAAAADGTLLVLVSGIVELAAGDARDVAGLVTIDAQGRVRAPVAVPVLTSPSDPADGARLGVRPGGSSPWLMVVDADALRVYRPA